MLIKLTSPYSSLYVTLLVSPGNFPFFLIGTNAVLSFWAIIGPKTKPRASRPTTTSTLPQCFCMYDVIREIQSSNTSGCCSNGHMSLEIENRREWSRNKYLRSVTYLCNWCAMSLGGNAEHLQWRIWDFPEGLPTPKVGLLTLWILYSRGRVWVHHLSSPQGHCVFSFLWWLVQFFLFVYACKSVLGKKATTGMAIGGWWPLLIVILVVVTTADHHSSSATELKLRW